MNRDDAIDISDDSDGEGYVDRREILAPAIYDTIAALGGREGSNYKLGDEAYGCLKDLKKYWRKDDTDDERTVARIFWESRVLPNDLVPILLETAGKGRVEDKCAIACADIVTAMTWPIDMAEELKELDEELDKGTDYTQLLQSHLHYKGALLRPGVIQSLLGIMLPCVAKDKKERKERDSQIVNVVLHLFRNLAFIKDMQPNIHASSDQTEFSMLQSKLIETMSQAHIFDLLLTMASNAATDTFFNQWNTVIMEIFYLLFRGVLPPTLAVDQAKRSQGALSRLLEEENKAKTENARRASSRHSRFGTTISIKLNTAKSFTKETTESQAEMITSAANGASDSRSFVLHRQRGLNQDVGDIFDLKKKRNWRKTNKIDELSREDNLTYEAKVVLRNLAVMFVETCFNAFLSSLLKDIKSERPKITEKDHLRLLFLVKWFLEFYIAVRTNAKCAPKDSDAPIWGFDLVGEVIERSWIVWILKRMREAVEDKPKLWTELQAGLECLTQLLQLIDNMSSSHVTDPDLNEAAELLQQQLVYNGEVLDIAIDSLRSYKEGVQSLRYLDSSVRLAYTLLKMLERWSKVRGGEVYVRKKAKPKRARKGKGGEAAADAEEEEQEAIAQQDDDEPLVQETMFSFEAFEIKFAHEDITHTLLTYLSRYGDFTFAEQMKRVVNLLHRQAVKAKAEGLFFKVSTLNLFKGILAKQGSLPKDQAYKDLINLINFILKKFFKQVTEDPLLAVEAFFPKNRNRWKQYSSWEPEAKQAKRGRELETNSKHPEDVQVKKGYSWSEQLGIAIACLKEKGQEELITWIKEILAFVTNQRQRIVEETDGSASQLQTDAANTGGGDNDDEARAAALRSQMPSAEAIAKFEDYLIPYISDEQADAATKNPHMKLVFRLVKFAILDENADEIEWYTPAAILPSDLQRSLNVITQFETNPFDLSGKSASSLLTKSRRRRRRRRSSSNSSNASNSGAEDDAIKKQKRKKKAKEKQVYKSAQFIEDSDAEYGDDEAFFAKEKAHRERTARAAAEGIEPISTMRSTGTKKRKKKRGTAGGRDVDVNVGGDADADDIAEPSRAVEGGSDIDEDDEARKRARLSSSADERDASSLSESDVDVARTGRKAKSKKGTTDTPLTTPPDAPNKGKRGKTKGTAKGKVKVSTKEKSKPKEKETVPSKPKMKPNRPRPAWRISGSPSPHASEDEDAERDNSMFPSKSKSKKTNTSSDTTPLLLHNEETIEDGDTRLKASVGARSRSLSSSASTPLFLSDDDGEDDEIRAIVARRSKPKRVLVLSDDEDE